MLDNGKIRARIREIETVHRETKELLHRGDYSRALGGGADSSNATRLSANECVQARIAFLQSQAAERAVVTVEDIARLLTNVDLAAAVEGEENLTKPYIAAAIEKGMAARSRFDAGEFSMGPGWCDVKATEHEENRHLPHGEARDRQPHHHPIYSRAPTSAVAPLDNLKITPTIRELQAAHRQLRNGPITVRMTGQSRGIFASCKRRTGSGTRCGDPCRVQQEDGRSNRSSTTRKN